MAPGETDHPALALVNTRDADGDALVDPAALTAWIAQRGLAPAGAHAGLGRGRRPA